MALTVDLVATTAPFTLAERDTPPAVAHQTGKLGFVVLPVDDAVSADWLHPQVMGIFGFG